MRLIDLIHVRREFDGGRIIAVDDISLSIGRGETVAIVGPSGCGKSTLLNLICGLDWPTSGAVLFEGRPIRSRTEWARVRARRIGIVFQSFCLIPTLTARENVEVAMIGQLTGAQHRRERALALLQRMDLADRVDLRPPELSGGERQRVAIARALANKPDVLVADEPTGSLDRRSSRSIMEVLTDLQRSARTTLVVITHDPSVAAYCKRHIELIDGRVANDAVPPAGSAAAMMGPS
jgi:putative ABC transport system ATP-binding protein